MHTETERGDSSRQRHRMIEREIEREREMQRKK